MLEKEDQKKTSREIPKLTHVETKKQEVDPNSIADAIQFQKAHDIAQKTKLDAEAITSADKSLLTGFEKKRMLLDRIWIIANQARAQMQLEPLKREEIKHQLMRLVDLGYLTYEEIPYEKSVNEVFILTEKGEEIIQ